MPKTSQISLKTCVVIGISKRPAPIFFLNKSSIRIFKSWIFKLSTLELRCLLAGGGWKGTSAGSRPSKVRFNRSACQGPRAVPTRISPRLFQMYFCQGGKLDFLLLFPRSRVSHCLGREGKVQRGRGGGRVTT